jgi:DNA-binding NarL/FixJ family response regulator
MSGKAILIVDDEAAHRVMARRAFVKHFPELQVLEASSVSTAKHLLASHLEALMLVILDLNLDHESGLEVLQLLRAQKSYSDLPCVVISTSDLEKDVHQSYQCGANCYIVKDTDPVTYRKNLSAAISYFLIVLG